MHIVYLILSIEYYHNSSSKTFHFLKPEFPFDRYTFQQIKKYWASCLKKSSLIFYLQILYSKRYS